MSSAPTSTDGEALANLIASDPSDEALRQHVHPKDWVNPTPSGRYHLVVVGGGTAGLVTAAGAAGLGARVALVEKNLLGGDCLNFGCVPSKAILAASRKAAAHRGLEDYGVCVSGDFEVDFAMVMERMRRLRSEISVHDSAARFRELGVDVYLGHGQFTSPNTLTVGDAALTFRKAVIATGARASAPPIPGLHEVGFLTNESLFRLTERPRRLGVVGGGPIGSEMAQAFARLGSEVHMVELAPRLLPRDDEDAAALLADAMNEDGVHLHLGISGLAFSRTETGRVMNFEEKGKPVSVEVDEVLVAAGRLPNVEGLGLEAARVAFDARRGVEVDGRLRTSAKRIFAAGDVCTPYRFTHAADAMARIVIQNALFMGRAKVSGLVIPWCTYTDPEVAHVGLTGQQIKEQGLDVTTIRVDMSDVDRAVLDGEVRGFVKIHVKTGSAEILGATVMGRDAGDLLAPIVQAMTTGQGMKALQRTIRAYPTRGDAVKRAGDAWMRGKLTPFVQGLLKRWLSWTL